MAEFFVLKVKCLGILCCACRLYSTVVDPDPVVSSTFSRIRIRTADKTDTNFTISQQNAQFTNVNSFKKRIFCLKSIYLVLHNVLTRREYKGKNSWRIRNHLNRWIRIRKIIIPDPQHWIVGAFHPRGLLCNTFSLKYTE
jgi:hypothetical protein